MLRHCEFLSANQCNRTCKAREQRGRDGMLRRHGHTAEERNNKVKRSRVQRPASMAA
jgi:hypothetical protein